MQLTPGTRPIAISAVLRDAIYAHARTTYPDECCGYLTGAPSGASVDNIVRCTNAQNEQRDVAQSIEGAGAPARDADRGFVIAGAELLRFAKSFDGPAPARIVYHSHTNGRAYFSELDRAMAAGPAYPVQHLVVGVGADGVTEAAQFAWSDAAGEYVEVARWQVAPAARRQPA